MAPCPKEPGIDHMRDCLPCFCRVMFPDATPLQIEFMRALGTNKTALRLDRPMRQPVFPPYRSGPHRPTLMILDDMEKK